MGVSQRGGLCPSLHLSLRPTCPNWGRSALCLTISFMWMEESLCLLKENHQCSKQEGLAHWFRMRIELPVEMNTAYHSLFSCIRNITLCKLAPLKSKEKALYLLGKQSMLEAGSSNTLFSWGNWVDFVRNTAYLSGISNVKNMTFVQNSSIQVDGRNTVSLLWKQSMLEAGGSSTLFSFGNCFTLLKEYLLSESVLKWVIHFTKSIHFKQNGETHVSHGKIQCIRGQSLLHTFSLWELSYLLKRMLPTTHCFHVWGTSTLCNIAPFKWMIQTLYSSEKTINMRRWRVKHNVSIWEFS
jgi:hypothetical protein